MLEWSWVSDPPTNMKYTPRCLVFLLFACLVPFPELAHAQGGARRILFVRGGNGSGGFLEGGSDEHLSDISNFSSAAGNHGFGELAELLRADGFVVEQVQEGPSPTETPIDFATLDLAQVSVLVLGSNNATYSTTQRDLLVDFVRIGGGLLLISDANWGSNWGDAPTSDQAFLGPFDLVMNQDRSTYSLSRAAGDFIIGGVDQGAHPILAGVDGVLGTADDIDSFDGEGVSPLTVVDLLPGINPVILARAKGTIRVNDNPNGGSSRSAGPNDAALVIAELGQGRLAGHFDRNTFFNENGAGTSLHQRDNRAYARSLFAWLAGPLTHPYGAGKVNSGGQRARLAASGNPAPGNPVFALTARNALPHKPGLFLDGSRYDNRPFQGGRLLVDDFRRLPVLRTDASGRARQPFDVTLGLVGSTRYFQLWYRDPQDPTGFGSGLSGGLRVSFVP